MRLLTSFILLLLALNASSQELHIRQWQANAGIVNPAFTGISANPRLYFSYRDQWKSEFKSYMLGYDQRISLKAGNIGAYIQQENAGNFSFTSFASAQYAYNFKVDDELSLRAGITAGFFRKTLDVSKLRFWDTPDPSLWPDTSKPRGVLSTNITFFTGVGGAMFYRNLFLAGAIYNINFPKYSFNNKKLRNTTNDICCTGRRVFSCKWR